MITSSGFNAISNSLHQMQQNQYFTNSVESSSSMNSNSLLAAANTLTFNNSRISSSGSINHQPIDAGKSLNSFQSSFLKQENLRNSLLNSNKNLDFDLQLDFNKNNKSYKDPKLDAMILSLTNKQRSNKKLNNDLEFDQLFKTEDDEELDISNDNYQTVNSDDDDIDNDIDELKDNYAIMNSNQPSKRSDSMKVGKILENPIKLANRFNIQTNLGKTMSINMPIEQTKIDSNHNNINEHFINNFDSIPNSNW